MKTPKKFLSRKQSQLFRSLIATAFIANGFFPFVAPAFAEGTKAGQGISNSANATYVDPNAPTTTINATSNTVTVTVAEVAGITVLADTSNPPAITKGTGTSTAIEIGDTLTYNFVITNVGNDPTKFRIPNLATTTGPVAVSGNLQRFDTTLATPGWVDLPAGEYITDSIAVGGFVQVRVKATVQAGAKADEVITVQLGDTPGNGQNLLRVNNGGDVYTVDNVGTANGDIAGDPLNGTREASDIQTSKVGASPKNLALATLLKTIPTGGYKDNDGGTATPTNLADDTVTYNLSLRVENNDVTGQGITVQPLAGYAGISVNNDETPATDLTKKYILVSDVIPTGTKLLAAPATVTGWTPVYSTVAIDTFKPDQVRWSTVAPTDLTTVKRVGYVKETPNTTDYIAVNTTVSGFSIKLGITGTPSSLTIQNIAQLVGQTPGTNGLPVYDESGDQNPSNYNGPVGNMTPGATDANGDGLPDSPTAVTDTITNGVADSSTQGADLNNNNTGQGPGGEVNILTIGAAGVVSILNGPLNAPATVGPDGTTATDFTNKSSIIPAGTTPGSLIEPQAVGFSNTILNSGGAGTITLVPTKPANQLDLPDKTTVTINYGSQSAVYEYKQSDGTFSLKTGTAISIAAAANTPYTYGVEVKLPSGTKLSTDTIIDYTGDTEWGYPVPITSTVTDASNNTATNITIDRVYTGFLQMIKVSRILQGSGEAVVGNQGSFESTPKYTNPVSNVEIDPSPTTDEVRTPGPGNIIEYQIRYKNISNVQPSSGGTNVILNADKVEITEDGAAGTNNWAKDNDNNGIIDTSNVIAPQANDSNNGTITFSPSINQSGITPDKDVTKYVNTLKVLITPQLTGTFTFQRKVN